jgi:hypothetical protein
VEPASLKEKYYIFICLPSGFNREIPENILTAASIGNCRIRNRPYPASLEPVAVKIL